MARERETEQRRRAEGLAETEALARKKAETAESLAEDQRRKAEGLAATEALARKKAETAESLAEDQRRKAEGLAATEALARKKAEVAESVASASKDDALAKLWDSYLQTARGLRHSRRPGQRFAALRAVTAALALPVPPGRSRDELRTEAIAALLLPDFEVAQEWDGWPAGSTGYAINGTFERFARSDANGNVSVRQVKGDVELWRLPAIPATLRVPGHYGLDFSPDGRFLNQVAVTPQGERRRLWKLDGPKPAVVLEGDYITFTFSPDSRQFAAVFADRSLRVYNLETATELKRYQPPRGPYRLCWNPRQPCLQSATTTVTGS